MKLVVLYETNGKNRLLHKMLLDVGYQDEMITENRRHVLSDNCIYAEDKSNEGYWERATQCQLPP